MEILASTLILFLCASIFGYQTYELCDSAIYSHTYYRQEFLGVNVNHDTQAIIGTGKAILPLTFF